MQKILFLVTFITLFGGSFSVEASATPDTSAKKVVESFYKVYIASLYHGGKRPTRQPDLPFSQSFKKLIAQDTKVCKEKAGTDICGWGADGEIYLDSQEVDPKLTLENSGFTAEEDKPGTVVVKLNVFPHAKGEKAAYDRTITFLMVQENKRWVVDDVLYAAQASSRKQIQDEINVYSKP